MATPDDVLLGRSRWSVQEADCLAFLANLPADSVDLVLGSPPYAGGVRTYGIDFHKSGEEWVAWMVQVFRAALRVCRGLVCLVCQGPTKKHRWDATPALLMADLHRAGIHLLCPPLYRRVGVPGSGGARKDHAARGGGANFLRNDYEFCVVAHRGGKLPWADGTACGHPPKWAPGGQMSNRLANGARVNQWGRVGGKKGMGNKSVAGEAEPTRRPSILLPGVEMETAATPTPEKPGKNKRTVRRVREGQHAQTNEYAPPTLANPGNVVQQTYTAQEVQELLSLYEQGDFVDCTVGGGAMGDPAAHTNEAAYPLSLAEFLVRSFCEPGGVCLDPFSGSATTGHAALLWDRRYLGCDVRASQVEKSRARLARVTPPLPGLTVEVRP